MNFLADESIDRQIIESLRAEGHEVAYVAEMEPGISDDQVLDRANAIAAILLTQDKDFGELVYRLKRVSIGVVLFRLAGMTPAGKAACASESCRYPRPELGRGIYRGFARPCPHQAIVNACWPQSARIGAFNALGLTPP